MAASTGTDLLYWAYIVALWAGMLAPAPPANG